jgi:3-hydroxyacyl-[acyl-carrier-protein] dehydratase
MTTATPSPILAATPSTGAPADALPGPPPPLAAFDRVVELEPGSHAVALRNVPGTLSVFDTHFPRQPILPGVLLLEDMAALAAAAAGEAPWPWRLHRVKGLRFRHFVCPGDQVELTARLTARAHDTAVVRATARVDARTVATVRALVLTRAAS